LRWQGVRFRQFFSLLSRRWWIASIPEGGKDSIGADAERLRFVRRVDAVNEQGRTFGWSALIEPRRYTASAVCLGEVKVLAIDRADLMKLLEEDLQLGFTVMKKVAEINSSRLRNTRSQLRSARTEGLITHG
jgi:CRP-like cAMP-binding protein